jgi:hypothetical protein
MGLDLFLETSIAAEHRRPNSWPQIERSTLARSAKRGPRPAGSRWLQWLRTLPRWILAPWQRTSGLVDQIAQLETVMAGHVATLARLQTALDYDAATGARSRLYFFAALRQNIAHFARDEHTRSGKGFTIGK